MEEMPLKKIALGVIHERRHVEADGRFLQRAVDAIRQRFPGETPVAILESHKPITSQRLREQAPTDSKLHDTLDYWSHVTSELEKMGVKVVHADHAGLYAYGKRLEAKLRDESTPTAERKKLKAKLKYVEINLREARFSGAFEREKAHMVITGAGHTAALAQQFGLEKRYSPASRELDWGSNPSLDNLEFRQQLADVIQKRVKSERAAP